MDVIISPIPDANATPLRNIAAQNLLERLRPADKVSVAAFGSSL